MITYGALLNVYNEELLLPYCLESIMADIDQCVIVNAGADSPSTDRSKIVIGKFVDRYPEKIDYYEGCYANPDGSWDESAQVNFGLSKIKTDFVIRIHADIVFDEGDIARIKQALRVFPDKAYLYSFQRDFWVDTKHIKLYEFSWEQQLPHPISNDPIALSMRANPTAFDDDSGKFGITLDMDWQKDVLWLPDVRKYHFGFCKPFPQMFEKVYISMKKGDFFPDEKLSEKELYERSFNHVKSLIDSPSFDYAGEFPAVAEPIRNISMRDGYEEFETWIREYLK